ncbi:MAG: polyamine aminopropyltransferase [Myxococcota bacterium]
MSSVSRSVPDALEDGSTAPETRGFEKDNWYLEETAGSVRQSFRFAKKLHEEQTDYQRLVIYDTPFFGKVMTLDDLVMFTERDEFIYHEMLVHVPLCSLKGPKRVLIIGGGDCGCLREALKHDDVSEVVQVDIDRRVTAVSREYFPWAEAATQDPRATLLFEDGVRYIQDHPAQFDLVVIDSTDPKGFALDLFLSTFYSQVAAALKPHGIMTAQSESPHWSTEMVGAIYGELRQSFAAVNAYLASVPTYASGLWTLAHASARPRSPVDAVRAEAIAATCRYYNAQIHEASFALPNFVRDALRGRNAFEPFDARVQGEGLEDPGSHNP